MAENNDISSLHLGTILHGMFSVSSQPPLHRVMVLLNMRINEQASTSWMDNFPPETRVTAEVALAAINRARVWLDAKRPRAKANLELSEAERTHQAESLFVSATDEYIEQRVRLHAELKLAKRAYLKAVEDYLLRPPSVSDLYQLESTREERKLQVEARRRKVGAENLEALRQRILRERAEETEADRKWREIIAKANSPESVAAQKREEEDYRRMAQLIDKVERRRI